MSDGYKIMVPLRPQYHDVHLNEHWVKDEKYYLGWVEKLAFIVLINKLKPIKNGKLSFSCYLYTNKSSNKLDKEMANALRSLVKDIGIVETIAEEEFVLDVDSISPRVEIYARSDIGGTTD
jgi:hypothetical protein